MDRTKTVACLSALLFASCSHRAAIVVGSKNFTEQLLLGEILAQRIENRLHVPVIRKLDLGGTLLAHAALISGSIDLYPEYTGTALASVLKLPPSSDPAAVLQTVRAGYRGQWHLEWLAPLGFNNTFAMVVRQPTEVKTLSQAAAARAWRMGIGYEFRERPDGLDGLLKTYGLRLQGDPVTMDLGLLYSALDAGKVDMIAANSTDGQLSVRKVAVLEDNRHYFPPYQCAVVARESTLARYPELRAALDGLSGKLSDQEMRRLNYEVDGKHRQPGQVAQEFLKTLQ